jgi:hypothetical protein
VTGAKEKQLWDAMCLLMLIADSEKARREGRWITQDQLQNELHERFGI